MTRPVVGVSGPDRGGEPAWWFTRLALFRAGASAVRLRPSGPPPPEQLDAVVIGGGADVDPILYGGAARAPDEIAPASVGPLIGWIRRVSAIPPADAIDPARDTLERELIETALARGTPLLGICRGAQLLNVVLGGSLGDVSAFYGDTPHPRTVRPAKPVDVLADTVLAATIGAGTCRVNSLHLQAVDRLAERLRVAARDRRGVVQAIEHCDHEFCLGVQWHPEYLPLRRRHLRLFEGLVSAARRVSRP